MANGDYKAFIVEGEAREPQIIDNISKVFFSHRNYEIITLPAGENIYMLWKKLKEDDFDTDIIEVCGRAAKKLENNWKCYREKIFRKYTCSLIMIHIRQISGKMMMKMFLPRCLKVLIMKQKMGNYI